VHTRAPCKHAVHGRQPCRPAGELAQLLERHWPGVRLWVCCLNPKPITCAQVSSFGSLPRVRSGGSMAAAGAGSTMSKVESIASSAVRVAEKIQARRAQRRG